MRGCAVGERLPGLKLPQRQRSPPTLASSALALLLPPLPLEAFASCVRCLAHSRPPPATATTATAAMTPPMRAGEGPPPDEEGLLLAF